jgi:hypothetical protein
VWPEGLVRPQVVGHVGVLLDVVIDVVQGDGGGAGQPQQARNSVLDVLGVLCKNGLQVTEELCPVLRDLGLKHMQEAVRALDTLDSADNGTLT